MVDLSEQFCADSCKFNCILMYYCPQCVPISGLGFRRGSYKCVCKDGYYFPDIKATNKYYNGSEVEIRYREQINVSLAFSHTYLNCYSSTNETCICTKLILFLYKYQDTDQL